MAKRKSGSIRYRDSKTGRFIPRRSAAQKKSSTYTEHVKTGERLRSYLKSEKLFAQKQAELKAIGKQVFKGKFRLAVDVKQDKDKYKERGRIRDFGAELTRRKPRKRKPKPKKPAQPKKPIYKRPEELPDEPPF